MTRRKAPLQPESLPGFLLAIGWEEEGRARIRQPSAVNGQRHVRNRSVGPWSRLVRRFVPCGKTKELCAFRPFTITDRPSEHGPTERLHTFGYRLPAIGANVISQLLKLVAEGGTTGGTRME